VLIHLANQLANYLANQTHEDDTMCRTRPQPFLCPPPTPSGRRPVTWRVLILGLVLAGPVQSQLIPETSLAFSHEDPAPRTRLAGDSLLNNSLGEALAAGDFNGDGYLDLVIGTPQYGESQTSPGAVNVVYGGPGGLSATDAAVENQFWNQAGAVEGGSENGDRSGHAVAAADFNGDGVDDLVFGSPGEDIGSISNAGAFNVIYGSPSGLTSARNRQFYQGRDIGIVDGVDFGAVGGAAERDNELGWSLATADFDQDGFDDVAVGIRREDIGSIADVGSVQVFFGSANGLTAVRDRFLDRSVLAAAGPPEQFDRFGETVAAGDFNGDGWPDLAVGAPWDEQDVSAGGTVHLIYGTPDGFDRDNDELLTMDAPSANDEMGKALTVGDFDGDGLDDLVIGTPGFDNASGAALLIYGAGNGLGSSPRRLLLRPGSDAFPGSAQQSSRFASSLSAGDIDGDGVHDLIVGRRNFDLDGNSDIGQVLIAFGRDPIGVLGFGSVLWTRSDLSRIGSARQNDRFGTAVLLADFNADGRADAAISSPDRSVGGVNGAGDVVVISTSEGLFSDRFEVQGSGPPGL
jgi:hypothetical protein